MKKLWLPPIEECCDNAEIYFSVNIDLNLHLVMKCKSHGFHNIANPLARSKHDLPLIPSKELSKAISLYKSQSWDNTARGEQ